MTIHTDNQRYVRLFRKAAHTEWIRRCGGFVTSIHVSDLAHVYDAIIPRTTQSNRELRFLCFRARSPGGLREILYIIRAGELSSNEILKCFGFVAK